jgi:hypothetical protein
LMDCAAVGGTSEAASPAERSSWWDTFCDRDASACLVACVVCEDAVDAEDARRRMPEAAAPMCMECSAYAVCEERVLLAILRDGHVLMYAL